jgi:hypothetical protein
MRGTTVKRINKFVKHLIDNTSGDLGKTRKQLIGEVKILWKSEGKKGQTFIKDTLAGKFDPK